MRPIRELVSGRPVVVVTQDASALDAARLMTSKQVGCVLVLDHRGKAEGVFTERDLMTRVVVKGADPARVRVAEVMTREIFAADPARPIGEVRREMRARHIRHVPIVEHDRVIAMLSLRDLLYADLAEQQTMVRQMQDYIRGQG